MIPNPVAADVLDRAAVHVSEVEFMPLRNKSNGLAQGDPGHDLRTAVIHGMCDLHMADNHEFQCGTPHEAALLEIVADFGTVPEMDPAAQWQRFQGANHPAARLEDVERRDRRRLDIWEWSRGRATTEVANLLRWAAEDFRAKDPFDGVYAVLNLDEARVRDQAEADKFYQQLVETSDAAKNLPPEIADALGQIGNPADFLRRLLGGEDPFGA